jgi:hypothetical protein
MGDTRTRQALHAVAELVLAGPQHRRSGTIRLRVVPGGFGTVAEPALRVVGTELLGAGSGVPLDGRTATELAAAVGVEPGAPEGLYHDGSGVGLDEAMRVDPAEAAAIHDALARGDAAMRALAPDQTPVLWPEHFDLGITVNEINYGVSAGDGYLDEPYAYVGPWQSRVGEFWNAPFGAAHPVRELPDLLAFFNAGRAAAA